MQQHCSYPIGVKSSCRRSTSTCRSTWDCNESHSQRPHHVRAVVRQMSHAQKAQAGIRRLVRASSQSLPSIWSFLKVSTPHRFTPAVATTHRLTADLQLRVCMWDDFGGQSRAAGSHHRRQDGEPPWSRSSFLEILFQLQSLSLLVLSHLYSSFRASCQINHYWIRPWC